MNKQTYIARLMTILAAMCISVAGGCAHKPPTIAHTHIGHAITGFEGTPGDKGLFVVAEERAKEAQRLARDMVQTNVTESQANNNARELIAITTTDTYSLQRSLEESIRHIEFAADVDDASGNVRTSATQFATAANDILRRCSLIALLAADFTSSRDLQERQQMGAQINDLVEMNVDGQGGEAAQIGTKQLREMLDAMIAGEVPPYTTVDQFYLFHLVRLPECDTCWGFVKWANSSNRGY